MYCRKFYPYKFFQRLYKTCNYKSRQRKLSAPPAFSAQFDANRSFETANPPDFTLDPRSYVLRQVSTDFPLSSLAFGEEDEGEEHHRLSLSIGRRQRHAGRKKKRNEEGTPKRDLSSSLTNDKTNNGAARLILREHAVST